MGNSQPSDPNGTQDHQRLGTVKINQAEDPQTHQIFSTMQLTRAVQSQKALDIWLKQTNKIDDSQTREVLLLPLKHQFQKAGMCGSTGLVTLTYENYSFILQNQIKNRQVLKKFFLDTQMWYLLYNMIRAGNKFQRFKSKIGDLHPSNVLINDDGQVKIISTCSLPNEANNFQKAVQNKDAQVFLAPQELDQTALTKGQYPPNIDPCKAQVFTIGLTLLSSGTLESCDQVYQKTNTKNGWKINFQRIRKLLNMLGQKYPPLLVQTISGMLSQSPSQRKRSSQIYQLLFPYQNEILQLEPFNIPTKISSNVHQSNYSAQNFNQGNQMNSNYNPVPGQRTVTSAYVGGYQYQGGNQGTSYQTGGGYPYNNQKY